MWMSKTFIVVDGSKSGFCHSPVDIRASVRAGVCGIECG